MNITDNIVDIYIINTSTVEDETERVLPMIAPHYARKYEKAKVTNVKLQELCAGFLLYKCLGINRDEQLTISEHGKPSLNVQSIEKRTQFSLSHSDHYVILAVSDTPVGVDIERADRVTLPILKRVLPSVYYEKLEKKMFPPEIGFENDDQLMYAKYWTSVEAILKATGTGFITDPRNNPNLMDEWYLKSSVLEKHFVMSCASRTPFSINTVIIESI